MSIPRPNLALVLALVAAAPAVEAQDFLPEATQPFAVPLPNGGPFVLDRDGDRLAVGSPEGSSEGFVRVLERDADGAWVTAAELEGAALAADLGADLFRFGVSVALDGDRLAVGSVPLSGAPIQSTQSPFIGGALLLFERDPGGTWNLIEALNGAQRTNTSGRFGAAVDLRGDTLVVGAPGESSPGVGMHGAAYRFQRLESGFWVLAQRTQSFVPGRYGEAVAVGESYLAIADPDNDRVDTWRRLGGWSPYPSLAGAPVQTFGGNAGRFGVSLAIEGDFLAVGTGGNLFFPPIPGAAEVFRASGAQGWGAEALLVPEASDAIASSFGGAVAFDAGRLAVRAPRVLTDLSGTPFESLGVRVYDVDASGLWTSSARYVSNELSLQIAYGPTFDDGGLVLLQGGFANHQLVDFAAGDFVRQGQSVSLAAGGSQGQYLFAGKEREGDLYLVLGSLTGTAPGLPVGGFDLPLIPDAWTDYLLTDGALLAGGVGILDAAGRGVASLDLPPGLNPNLAGLSAWHAYLALDPSSGSITAASQAIELALVP